MVRVPRVACKQNKRFKINNFFGVFGGKDPGKKLGPGCLCAGVKQEKVGCGTSTSLEIARDLVGRSNSLEVVTHLHGLH